MAVNDNRSGSESLRKTLSRKLKRARAIAGYQQAEAARLLEVSSNTVSGWERGEFQPTMQKLELIADLYDVPAWWLLHPGNTRPPASRPADERAQGVA